MKNLHEMSLDELKAELVKTQTALAEAKATVTIPGCFVYGPPLEVEMYDVDIPPYTPINCD